MSAYTYPGVYIEEVPSAVHTITGVATSVAAFIGWAAQGPTDQATLVNSFSDFQRIFGGLNANSYLGYSVNQFFANGGSKAFVVRLTGTGAKAADSSGAGGFKIGNLTLFAKNFGVWGNSLVITVSAPVSGRFGILVQQTDPNGGPARTLENFVNLSADANDTQGNFFLTVINTGSDYVTFIDPANPGAALTPNTTVAAVAAKALKNGADGTILKPSTTATAGAFETALLATDVGVNLLSAVAFNLLVVPGEIVPATISTLQAFVADQKNRAFYIVDPDPSKKISDFSTSGPPNTITAAPNAANSAFYFPWISAPDPLAGNRPKNFPPSGFIAGIYAATDATRGVWKAPAGIDAGITGINGLQFTLTDQQNGDLNTKAINALRSFPVYGNVVWGARTLVGNDAVGSQWKYVPVRRFALFLESSLYNGTQWAVFEPNDETLWSQLRLNIGAFMQGLFQKGAFQGTTPQQAYFVKCDAENNPQSSIDLGIVNVTVGFAPLKPAEFVVIQIQQIAGQLAA